MMLQSLLMIFLSPAWAADGDFSRHLFKKFQVKACTTCHDFHEKKRGGLAFKSHKDRTPDMCAACHSKDVTGFRHEEEWFARPGLYTSGMTAKQTCEAVKTALHAKFKSPELLKRDVEKHLFEDSRVLWAIEGATPQSGNLPEEKREADLVKGGLGEWKAHVSAWIGAGMPCR